MGEDKDTGMQCPFTRFSPDGCTAFVQLRVDRQAYEFARQWAVFHAEADPDGTAEEQLEGYLAMALMAHMHREKWKPPEEIAALYLKAGNAQSRCPATDEN